MLARTRRRGKTSRSEDLFIIVKEIAFRAATARRTVTYTPENDGECPCRQLIAASFIFHQIKLM